ncbi:MAG: type II toxin-antitoxin system VapC family toxin [Acetobacteraceae bacterium]
MSEALLFDTHIALWLDSGDARLRQSTRLLIDDCWQQGGTVLLSAVTAWEIALLAGAGRIGLDLPVEPRIERFLGRPGIEAVPLGWKVAAAGYRFHHLEHRNPADRLLIAAAIDLACPLVTYDQRIQRFAHRHGRQYGFAVVS